MVTVVPNNPFEFAPFGCPIRNSEAHLLAASGGRQLVPVEGLIYGAAYDFR